MSRAPLVLALAAVIGTFGGHALGRWQGYRAGVEAEAARNTAEALALQADLAALGRRLSGQAAELRQAREDRAALIEDLENAIRNAPGANLPSLGPDSLQRLVDRWAGPGPSLAPVGQ